MQLLEALRDATAVEQCALRFDYFSLHQHCRRLLTTLVTVLGDKLLQCSDIQHDAMYPRVVVPHILRAAAIELPGTKSWNDSKESLVMQQASAIIKKFILKEGAKESDKLQKMNIRPLQ